MNDSAAPKSRKTCPMCRKPRVEEYHPFCSRGCRDRDLNQWFGDGYAVPGRPAAPEELATEDWQRDE